MNKIDIGLPLIFILAMAVAGPETTTISGAEAVSARQAAAADQLLTAEEGILRQSARLSRTNAQQHLAQGCFYGYWRRC
jgi:hypothetical protein